MSNVPNINDIQKMTPDEVATLNREMGKRALRNFLLIMGIKWTIIIAVNHWARSMDKNA